MFVEYRPTKDLVLILKRARHALVGSLPMLRRLHCAGAPVVRTADAHYDPSLDLLIIVVRYLADGLDAIGLGMVQHVAGMAGAEVIDPDAASDAERRVLAHIGAATEHASASDVAGAAEAIALALHLVIEPPVLAAATPSPSLRPVAVAAIRPAEVVRVRPAASSAPPRTAPVDGAARAATIDERAGRMRRARQDERVDPVTRPRVRSPLLPAPTAAAPAAPRAGAASAPPTSAAPAASTMAAPATTPAGGGARAGSSTMPGTTPPPPPAAPKPATAAAASTSSRRRDAGGVDVRYLRSGRWAPARLRAISLKGAYLITGGLLRVGDNAHLALAFGAHGVLVRGRVFHVTSADDIASTGMSGFAVRFELDDTARTTLTALLTAAKEAGVTLVAPPPRAAIRLPVAWPLKLAASSGRVVGQALDVSAEGMFVRADRVLPVGSSLDFSIVLDDGGSPVAGRCHVVREINASDGKRRGLSAGYGVHIDEMGDDHRGRWRSFLGRVRARVDKRVIVGASPARVSELAEVLSAAGYAVVSGTDPGSLIRVTDGEVRPPDAALIDGDLADGQDPSLLEGLFRRRQVPVLLFRGDARRARPLIDQALRVSA
ncbi:MAG: PilZ domain-containing protein [Kofleriaceae bacterium]|nr:PilZ domain-containing protein [Kofleriaceae bacterium]MBP9203470.1 PilZ domain-containing protein [Kofleriaceae bacterium]